MITKSNLSFLDQLETNNNRSWFTENKGVYLEQQKDMISFADELLHLIHQHDDIETVSGKKALMRIYRDVRFSKDKSPYKNYWGVYFKRGTVQLHGGYYLHVQKGGAFVDGGIWDSTAAELKLIREAIIADEKGFREIINTKTFKQHFGVLGLHGAQLKNVPRGYDKDSPSGDLLRHKQFLIRQDFTEKELLRPDFVNKVNESFKAFRPLLDWMSYTLTHDGNGEEISFL
jgi:uncharacterized protein (TIGR02453 family)